MVFKGGAAMKGHRADDPNHYIRQRIGTLLLNAAKKPIVTVCAGAGCGKTRAVSDFLLQQQERPALWFQLYENDNDAPRFWENYTDTVKVYDAPLAAKYKQIGFPGTQEKLDQFLKIRYDALLERPYILVFDDFHHLEAPALLRFVEILVNTTPSCSTKILICRDLPNINIEALQIKGSVSEIHETDLYFSESELTEYFKKQGLNVDRRSVHEIYKDTRGWAFAVNLVSRSLRRVSNYFGYVKTTLKQNIHKLMEAEDWDPVSERLKRFLASLSLIDHLSVELVEVLADGDAGLLSELKRQNAYIRFDLYGGAFLFHHLYLEFLQTKQDILTGEEKSKTYRAAAAWCRQHNYKMDALNYYEKIGDYESVVSVLWELCEYPSYDFSRDTAGIFERAPSEIFDQVDFFAAMHLFTLIHLGRWQEVAALAEVYERKLLPLEETRSRDHTLGGVYFFWGYLRFLMGTMDDTYDFDEYMSKSADYLTKSPVRNDRTLVTPLGSWGSAVGSARKGAPQEVVEAADRMASHISSCFNITKGLDDLCRGELRFYQNDLRAAEPLFVKALRCAREHSQFEIAQRSLFYIMRLAVIQGDRTKTEQALRDLKALLEEEGYARRFITYDIAVGWYACVIRHFDMIPDWLKDEFASYGHAYFIENFGNQIKARYTYLKRNYLPLLAYIGEMRQRESILYGRVEMLAMEACVHYQMKNRPAAWASLREAYETAAPNDILTPFIELGKDMRTLAIAALRKQPDGPAPDIGIPRSWLESVRHKAASYAKNQSMFIAEHKDYTRGNTVLTAREHDVLKDLYHGFSQIEIADKQSLSVNTVKMVTKSIYEKLHVHKISDLIRIAAEQGLV
jgi:LuxR family maltose regulon positive regulatory protein